jgi:hypothetical protein
MSAPSSLQLADLQLHAVDRWAAPMSAVAIDFALPSVSGHFITRTWYVLGPSSTGQNMQVQLGFGWTKAGDGSSGLLAGGSNIYS